MFKDHSKFVDILLYFESKLNPNRRRRRSISFSSAFLVDAGIVVILLEVDNNGEGCITGGGADILLHRALDHLLEAGGVLLDLDGWGSHRCGCHPAVARGSTTPPAPPPALRSAPS